MVSLEKKWNADSFDTYFHKKLWRLWLQGVIKFLCPAAGCNCLFTSTGLVKACTNLFVLYRSLNVLQSKWGFSTLSCRCENDEFELVLVKSSRPTSSSVCSKNIIFSIFGKIFKYFLVNFGIKKLPSNFLSFGTIYNTIEAIFQY